MYRAFNGGPIGVDVPFDEAVELAAHYGFDGIYLDLDYLLRRGPGTVVQMLEERSLKAAGWLLPLSLTAEEGSFNVGLEELPWAAGNCSRVGATRCSTWVSPASDRLPPDEMFELLRDRVETVCRILAESDIRLGLEFIGPKTSRQGKKHEFIHTMDGMLELCDAVEVDNVGLLLDSWHLYTSGGSNEDVLELRDEQIVDVHINDAPAGVPREEQIDNQRCLPGATGVIDVGRFLECLDQIGYTGPVLVEPFDQELRELGNEEAIQRTKDAVDSVWPESG